MSAKREFDLAEFLPEFGMTRGQLVELLKPAIADIEEGRTVTTQELEEKYRLRREGVAIGGQNDDMNEFLPEFGMTRAELERKVKAAIKDLDEGHGVTSDELREELRRRQEERLKK